MDESQNFLGTADYIVFAAVLFISSSIGIFYRFSGGRQRTFKEYLLADQKMSMVPVAFSLMASFMSAITILGVSKENYLYGTQFIMINISYIISTPLCCYLYLPVFFRLQKISVYEYLECRFGKAARITASVAFTLQMTLYMGIVLFAPALALSAVTGISQTWSILAVGIVCTFYSSIGGMKAVLITDVFQSLLMFAAVFAVITQGVIDVGIKDIFKTASEGERLELFNVSLDPRVRHTVWSLGIGGVITYCSLYGVNQAQVQRLLTVQSLSKARKSLWLQWIILMALSLSTSFSGLVLFTYYESCDPKLSGKITSTDQILPLYVVERLGSLPGLSGLFISGIFSGSLSTVSSSLNSLSAVAMQDYILPLFPIMETYGEERAAALSKLLACGFGAICVGVAFMAQLLGSGVLQASLTIFGAVGGPLLALFTLGMVYRCSNQKGAVTGLICGLVMTLWIGFGGPKAPIPEKPLSIDGCDQSDFFLTSSNNSFTLNTNISLLQYEEKNVITHITLEDLYSVSYMWVGVIGFLVTTFVGIIVSHLTGGEPRGGVDPRLLSSWIWNVSDKEIMRKEEMEFNNESEDHGVEKLKSFSISENEHTRL